MGILADLELIVNALRAVDVFFGTLPANAELAKIKAELDKALAVVTPLGL